VATTLLINNDGASLLFRVTTNALLYTHLEARYTSADCIDSYCYVCNITCCLQHL